MTEQVITLIAAISINGAIGNNEGSMPWHIPEDLKHFKKTTKGAIVIMGRKTFDSIGRKPLPGRINIILSRKLGGEVVTINHEDGNTSEIHVGDIYTALLKAKQYEDKEIFIIGGSEIYKQTIDLADRLVISHVNVVTLGDGYCYFPFIDREKFEAQTAEHFPSDHIPFFVVTYKRIAE